MSTLIHTKQQQVISTLLKTEAIEYLFSYVNQVIDMCTRGLRNSEDLASTPVPCFPAVLHFIFHNIVSPGIHTITTVGSLRHKGELNIEVVSGRDA